MHNPLRYLSKGLIYCLAVFAFLLIASPTFASYTNVTQVGPKDFQLSGVDADHACANLQVPGGAAMDNWVGPDYIGATQYSSNDNITCDQNDSSTITIHFNTWLVQPVGGAGYFIYLLNGTNFQFSNEFFYAAPTPPTVGTVTLTPNPVQTSTSIMATVRFTDPDSGDVHTATADFGDGTHTNVACSSVVDPSSATPGSV